MIDTETIATTPAWPVGPFRVALEVRDERGQLVAHVVWDRQPSILHPHQVTQLRDGREAALLALKVQLGRPVVLA